MSNKFYRTVVCNIGLILCACSAYYFLQFYKEHSFLPPPFLMDRYDTFMDFYNVNWWANRGDFYSKWRGFYSPLNIFIANLLNDPLCVNQVTSIRYRACNRFLYLPFGIICACLTFFALFIYSRKNIISVYLTLIFFLSMPFFFAIERGNYVILCFMVLSISLFINNIFIKTILYATLVNIKFYIFLPAFLAIRKLKYILLFFLVSWFLLIFFSYFIIDPKWYLIPFNIINFSGYIPSSLNILWNTTTLTHFDLLISKFSSNIFLIAYVKFVIVFFKAYIIYRFYTFIRYAYQNHIDSINIFYISILFMLTFTATLNYYSIILLYPYFIYLNNLDKLTRISLTTIVLLCIPNIFTLIEPIWVYKTYTPDNSFYGWHLTIINQDLSAASITTPILIFALFLQFTGARIYEVTK